MLQGFWDFWVHDPGLLSLLTLKHFWNCKAKNKMLQGFWDFWVHDPGSIFFRDIFGRKAKNRSGKIIDKQDHKNTIYQTNGTMLQIGTLKLNVIQTTKLYSLLPSCWTFLVIFGEDKAMIKKKDPDML